MSPAHWSAITLAEAKNIQMSKNIWNGMGSARIPMANYGKLTLQNVIQKCIHWLFVCLLVGSAVDISIQFELFRLLWAPKETATNNHLRYGGLGEENKDVSAVIRKSVFFIKFRFIPKHRISLCSLITTKNIIYISCIKFIGLFQINITRVCAWWIGILHFWGIRIVIQVDIFKLNVKVINFKQNGPNEV